MVIARGWSIFTAPARRTGPKHSGSAPEQLLILRFEPRCIVARNTAADEALAQVSPAI
jgi:hypothetical protein